MRVKKGNQEFRIPEESLPNYLSQGFDLIDETGEVVKLGSKENSVAAIARENKELRRRNRLLEEGIKQRDSKILELSKKLEEAESAIKASAPKPDAGKEKGGTEKPKGETETKDDAEVNESQSAEGEGQQPSLLGDAGKEKTEGPYPCPVCGKECATTLGLSKHMKTHS